MDRHLKGSGVKDAVRIGEWLKERGINPDLIISSNATRAFHTAMIISRILEFPLNRFNVKKELYLASKESILRIVKAINPSIEAIMLVAYEPTLSSFVNCYLGHKTLENSQRHP